MDTDLKCRIDKSSLLKWQTEAESTNLQSSKCSRKFYGEWEVERRLEMSQKGPQRHFIGPGLPSDPSRTTGKHWLDQCWPGQTLLKKYKKKKKKKPFPPPILKLRGVPGKYSNNSCSRLGQTGKVRSRAMSNLHMHIWGQQNSKSHSLSDTSHCTRDIR